MRVQKEEMNSSAYLIRKANPSEFSEIGKLLIDVYSQLDGFPKENEMPSYYKMLENVGEFTIQTSSELLVAIEDETIVGAVVYFDDMTNYGSGGIATLEQNTAGFRLLAVSNNARGKGIGYLLSTECIKKATESNLNQMIIHSTLAMKNAWKMYDALGFERSEDLDFPQGQMTVYGFRLKLK